MSVPTLPSLIELSSHFRIMVDGLAQELDQPVTPLELHANSREET